MADTLEQFVLHPSMLDSALQASMAFIIGSRNTTSKESRAPFKPALPFALDEIVIVNRCTASMWALIQYHETKTEDTVERFDIDLCDRKGAVCVQMRGFFTLRANKEIHLTTAEDDASVDILKEPLVDALIAEQPPVQEHVEDIPEELLRKRSTTYLKKLIGTVLKIPDSQLDSTAPLGKYGLDSIFIVQLTDALQKYFDNISRTIFFKYQTIDALIEHFLKTNKDALIAMVGVRQKKVDEKTTRKVPSQALPGYYKQAQKRSGRYIQSWSKELTATQVQDVAIIGLAGRYPEAKDVGEFWQNLKEGRNCIREIPSERWNWREYYDDEKGKEKTAYTKWGGFIKDIDKFDPLFFRISPKEAEKMDPQERLFLEVAYAGIEDAGYTPETLADNGKVGVYIGVMNGNYPTGPGYWSIANRVSYLFDLKGPSMAVDSACSSSLTAIHLALESMYSGISECAIVGGVNLIVDPGRYLTLSSMSMLSTGDQNKSFGDQADGFVDSEGVGVILLKPLRSYLWNCQGQYA